MATTAGPARVRLPPAGNARLTLAPLWHGPGDPVMRIGGREAALATRTASGPAALLVRLEADGVAALAWGAGADEALARLPALLGHDDDPPPLQPQQPVLRRLARRFSGLRMTRGTPVFELLLPAILAQKVSGLEAGRSYRRLVRRLGEPAPGPLDLTLPASAALLAGLPYHVFHPLGVERRRADAIVAAARAAPALQAAADHRPAELWRRLLAVPGIGPWTAAEALRPALGDPDALSLGDYNLPALVAWALAGERRADDARMLELLEPYRGQRARVVMLLELGGLFPPRRGPRMAPRSIAAI